MQSKIQFQVQMQIEFQIEIPLEVDWDPAAGVVYLSPIDPELASLLVRKPAAPKA